MSTEKNLPEIVKETSEEFEAFANCQPLRPGMYWKCIKETSDGNGHEMEIGLTYLLVKVSSVEKKIHTVMLRPHPRNAKLNPERQTHDFLVEDFLTYFEADYDYEEVRKRELADIQGEVDRIQQGLMERQSNPALLIPEIEETSEVDFSLGLPSPDMDKDAGVQSLVELGSEEKLRQLSQQANNQKALAQAQANWISKQTTLLADTINQMAPFYSEQAAAALASCSDAVEHANDIVEAVKTMGLYTGKDVEVVTISEGQGADPSEPLTMFQRRLYMDEELIVNVTYGGADVDDFDQFCEEIRTNKAFIDRLIPTPRGVVSMRFRRKDKRYSENPYVNMMMNEKNYPSFLLIRNGENVYQVYSELATHDTQRLFPTKDEMDRPFRGINGEKIKFRDVRFTGSLRHHDALAQHYKRLLILLFGLHDREGMFGEFSQLPGPLNFLSEEVQQKIFRFVCDDESNLLASGRPKWSEWLSQKNKLLQSGSRVVCHWGNLLNLETCPGATREVCGSYSRFEVAYPPKEDFDICIVRREGKDLVVTVPVSGFAGWKAKNSTREFNAKVRLTRYDAWEFAYLCLDDVKSADIDYYLNDRAEREDYLHYFELLTAARNLLQEDEAHESDMRLALKAALVEGKVADAEQCVEQEMDDAIRAWRAANRGKKIPQQGDKAFQKTMNTLLDNLYALVGAGRDRVVLAENLAQDLGRQPLRLVLTGKNKLVLYAAPLESDHLGIDVPHVWVKRIAIEERKTKFSAGASKMVILPELEPSETVLAEWPEASKWVDLENEVKASYAELQNLVKLSEQGCQDLVDLYKNGIDPELQGGLFEQFEAYVVQHSKKYVSTPNWIIPLAIVRLGGEKERKVYRILGYDMSGGPFLHRFGDALLKQLLVEWVNSTYKDKVRGRELLHDFRGNLGYLGLSGAKHLNCFSDSSVGRWGWKRSVAEQLGEGDDVQILTKIDLDQILPLVQDED